MFIDVALSRRLEAIEEAGCVGFAQTLGRLQPGLGCAVEKGGRRNATSCAPGSGWRTPRLLSSVRRRWTRRADPTRGYFVVNVTTLLVVMPPVPLPCEERTRR